MADSFAFDAEQDPTFGGAIAYELPGSRQTLGPASPNPTAQISDHSAEGAPWVGAAGNFERQAGWAWQATGSELAQSEYLGDHDEPTPAYSAAARDSYYGQTSGPQPGWNHAGSDGAYWDPSYWGPGGDTQPNTYGLIKIGRPFTINQGSDRHRTLATDEWDATGKRLNPADAPSAPHELYGSSHYTRPRFTPSEHARLQTWAWASGDQFPSSNPGYWGVQANEPNLAPRPQGSVVAQMPSDPYVSQSVPGPASSPDLSALYDLGY